MKLILLGLAYLLLSATPGFASEMFVVGEVYTATWCSGCWTARSALYDMYLDKETYPNLIPLIWQGDSEYVSPHYEARRALYGFSGIPYMRWGGRLVGNNQQNYDTIANTVSPLEITIADITIDNDNQFVVEVDLEVINNITTSDNRIIFLLTYDLEGLAEPYYFASVTDYYEEAFELSMPGETANYTRYYPVNPEWTPEQYYKIRAVVMVQTMSGDLRIHQAAKARYKELTPRISSNVQNGYPTLYVNFRDESLSSEPLVSWEWDLNGDGSIDSTERNPSYIYTESGEYDVSLTISDGNRIVTKSYERFIVADPEQPISGNISGIWHSHNNPHRLFGDTVIDSTSYLIIEPGVEVIIDGGSIEVKGRIYADASEGDPIVFTTDTTWNGILIDQNVGESIFINCRFYQAERTALAVNNVILILRDSEFVDNYSEDSAAALKVRDSSANLVGNKFLNNSSDTGVGAVDIKGSSLELSRNSFFYNHSNRAAGALKLESVSEVTFNNNYFSNNFSGYNAGALEVIASAFELRNSLFVNNTGFNAAAFSLNFHSFIDFINNTLVNNHITVNAFQIYNFRSTLNIINSIIRGEGTIVSGFGDAVTTAEHSNITGGFEGEGNIDTDPLFIQPTTGDGIDYDGVEAIWYLADHSPCIDAGNPAEYYNDTEDPERPGFALFPARGTLRNDMGAFGGAYYEQWVDIDKREINASLKDSDSIQIRAYPNPFNPTVNIELSKANQKPVSIEIYNVKGQLIRVMLKNDFVDRVNLTWDGKDNSNRDVSSGLYLIRVEGESSSGTKKIMLLK